MFPQVTETWVSAQGRDEMVMALKRVTVSVDATVVVEKKYFTGWIENDRFRLSLYTHRPTPFIPIMHGMVESTSGGCVLFVRYSMVPATRIFLLFWTLFILAAGAIMYWQHVARAYLVWIFIILGFIHLIAFANFFLHVKHCRETLRKVLFL